MEKENLMICSLCGQNISVFEDLVKSHGGEYVWHKFEEHNKECSGNKNEIKNKGKES